MGEPVLVRSVKRAMLAGGDLPIRFGQRAPLDPRNRFF
jgi:hypothetical protein